MNCCGLSSTGLENIDANELTSDNTTIYSNLNVSGNTNLNNVIVYGSSEFISSLNVSGFATLSNKTTINGTLNVSGFTILSNNTTINGSLYLSGLNVLETLNIHGTGLSTLYNFRSDNQDALVTKDSADFSTLIHGVYPGAEIKFDTVLSNSQSGTEGNIYLTKIDTNGKLNVYHKYNALIPLKLQEYWVVHDELEKICLQAEQNIAKFLGMDLKIDNVAIIANSAASGVAAIILALGIQSLIGGNTISIVEMKSNIDENTNNINSLSSFSSLSIYDLQNKTNFSSLNVSGSSTFFNNTTLLSSLNVSGLTTLSNNTTLLSSLNVSGTSIFNNISTFNNSLNISGISIFNNISTFNSSLNVSGTSIFNNISTFNNSLNISGTSIFNNISTFNNSLNVSGLTTLSNNTTLLSSLNISGISIFNNISTFNNSLNVSGSTTLSNNTTLLSSLNVSGTSIFNNISTFNNSLSISGTSIFNNNTTFLSSLNVSGNSLFNNNTTIYGILNISGYSQFNNNTTLLSSLNISGRTIMGNDIYDYSDSVFEAYKNLSIRKNVINVGDRLDLKVGLGARQSYISMEEGYDINLTNKIGGIYLSTINPTGNTTIGLSAKTVNVSDDLIVTGNITCKNLGQRTPIFFTTSRNVTLNGATYSCYDIDLRLYTNSILLDGYNIRQFRIRTWLSDTDFEHPNMYQNNYSVFMSDRNVLSIFAIGGPFENFYFNQANPSFNQMLYRNNFNNLMYCSRQGVKKVYCIIEDLL